MAIIKIIPNKPLTLSLKFPSPIEKQGKWGLQYLYTLSEPDGVIYLPPIAHDEIQKLHAGAGEPFTILKTIGHGNQAQWKVERIVQNQGQNGGNVQPDVQPSAPANVSNPERPAPAFVPREQPKSITNGHFAASNGDNWSSLKRALFSVIEDAKDAEEYASGKGLSIRFTGTDIRTMANTKVINMAGGR
jgi:hypothetical protein